MRKILSVAAALLCTAALLVSCSDGLAVLKPAGDHYEDGDGKLWYAASLSYEPVSTGEAVAKIGDTLLCEIPGMDSSSWLAETYEGIGAVYYSEEATLPSLSGFGAVSFIICREEMITISVAQSDDAELAREIAALVSGGEAAEPAASGSAYHIKFLSDSYPGLYYDILYIEGDNGKYYLYDRGEGRAVECGRILSEYMPTTGELLDSEGESEG